MKVFEVTITRTITQTKTVTIFTAKNDMEAGDIAEKLAEEGDIDFNTGNSDSKIEIVDCNPIKQ